MDILRVSLRKFKFIRINVDLTKIYIYFENRVWLEVAEKTRDCLRLAEHQRGTNLIGNLINLSRAGPGFLEVCHATWCRFCGLLLVIEV
jgi:hypothetical protein